MSWLTPRSRDCEQVGLADEDEVVVLGEVLEEQPQLAQVGQVMRWASSRMVVEHLAGVVEAEGLLDELAFAVKAGPSNSMRKASQRILTVLV